MTDIVASKRCILLSSYFNNFIHKYCNCCYYNVITLLMYLFTIFTDNFVIKNAF